MILAWFVMTVIAFIYSRFIFDKILLAPKEPDFITYKWLCQLGKLIHADSLCLPPMSLSIINLNLSGQFMTDMTVSMFAGLIIGSPFIIYQLWQFIMPALYDKERRYARRAVFIMSFLFILGTSFGTRPWPGARRRTSPSAGRRRAIGLPTTWPWSRRAQCSASGLCELCSVFGWQSSWRRLCSLASSLHSVRWFTTSYNGSVSVSSIVTRPARSSIA